MKKLRSLKASELSAQELAIVDAEERLVYECQKAIWALMRKKRLKAADLAVRLGVSEARISQMMSANATNLTLRTVARIFHALDARAVICDKNDLVEKGDERPTAELTHVPIAEALFVGRPLPESELWDQMVSRDPIGTLGPNVAYGAETVWVVGDRMAPARSTSLASRRTVQDASEWIKHRSFEPRQKVALDA